MSYSGECNGCGRCCEATAYGISFRCENLLQLDKLGKPGASECAVYATRTTGMPIMMVSPNGDYRYQSQCLPEYPRKHDAVPPECSYVWVSEIELAPKWHPGYSPSLDDEPPQSSTKYHKIGDL